MGGLPAKVPESYAPLNREKGVVIERPPHEHLAHVWAALTVPEPAGQSSPSIAALRRAGRKQTKCKKENRASRPPHACRASTAARHTTLVRRGNFGQRPPHECGAPASSSLEHMRARPGSFAMSGTLNEVDTAQGALAELADRRTEQPRHPTHRIAKERRIVRLSVRGQPLPMSAWTCQRWQSRIHVISSSAQTRNGSPVHSPRGPLARASGRLPSECASSSSAANGFNATSAAAAQVPSQAGQDVSSRR